MRGRDTGLAERFGVRRQRETGVKHHFDGFLASAAAAMVSLTEMEEDGECRLDEGPCVWVDVAEMPIRDARGHGD